MQQFHRIGQAYPELRPAPVRTHDYAEIYQSYAAAKAAEQASRCLQCGVPFCSVHCPLGNNIPDWLRLTAGGFLREAYEASAATNNFPEICGRICPQDRLCEGHCVVNKGFGSITIGSIEKFLTDTAWQQGWVQPFAPPHSLPYSVGIIGAGPAGMAAAEQLRRAGCEVHLYDRHDRAGGLMIYGIPHFKLDKAIVLARHRQYEASGIHFHFNTEIGEQLPFSELRSRHDAILIATGVYAARGFDPMPGVMLPGVVPAMAYLTASNKKCLGDAVTEISAAGKHVVVIGGGDTAMDCVRTAIRQEAASVTCLYRRDRDNMPGSQREVNHAIEEGVQFRFLAAPTAFLGTGRIEAVRLRPMRLGPPDRSGRREPVASDEPETTLHADMVIPALGYDAEDIPNAFAEPALALTPRGTLAIDAHFSTPLPGVFAAGDIARGASLVVWAIAEGRQAATQILSYLQTPRIAA